MTYETYKEELIAILRLERYFTVALSEVVELFMLGVAPESALKLNAEFEQIRKDLSDLRSYRSRLSAWFLGSRIGNPPTIR